MIVTISLAVDQDQNLRVLSTSAPLATSVILMGLNTRSLAGSWARSAGEVWQLRATLRGARFEDARFTRIFPPPDAMPDGTLRFIEHVAKLHGGCIAYAAWPCVLRIEGDASALKEISRDLCGPALWGVHLVKCDDGSTSWLETRLGGDAPAAPTPGAHPSEVQR